MASIGPVAIVTGAARPWGLGRAVAMGLAQEGFGLVVADVRDDWGQEAEAAIKKETGQKVLYVPTDVSQRASVHAMMEKTIKEFGRVDVLVNDAGIVVRQRVEEMTDETYDRIMNVNLRGAFLTCQAVVPSMREQGGGRIVNVASGGAFEPLKGLSAYAASKAGMVVFSKVLALETAQYGIVVTTVAPGYMHTGMGGETGPEEEEMKSGGRGQPFGRTLHPQEVAGVVIFAATNPSHILTGQTLHANGGAYMA